jgi:hypothetical protein
MRKIICAIGHGPRLVEDGSPVEKLNLKLVDSKVSRSGYMALRYLKS